MLNSRTAEYVNIVIYYNYYRYITRLGKLARHENTKKTWQSKYIYSYALGNHTIG